MGTRTHRLFISSFTVMLQLQLAECGYGEIVGFVSSTDRQTVEWPIANNVYTTAQRQILPVAISPETPPVNPKDVSLYQKYGYSAWLVGTWHQLQPRSCSSAALRQTKRTCTSLCKCSQCRVPVDVLCHQRHSHHRQGIAGAGDLSRLERIVRAELETAGCRRLFADHSLDDACPRRRHPDDQRIA